MRDAGRASDIVTPRSSVARSAYAAEGTAAKTANAITRVIARGANRRRP